MQVDAGIGAQRRAGRSIAGRRGRQGRIERGIARRVALLILAAPAACTPTVDVAGVYFPGWLVSSLTGIAASYGIVACLGRRRETRSLADSGLLYASLAVGIALACWWVFFSGF